MYNRKDELHQKLFQKALGGLPDYIPINYVPSSERFIDFIAMGIGYGMMPLQQCLPFIQKGQLIDLAPECNVPVNLYWHCWNLKSKILDKFTQQLIRKTEVLLGKDYTQGA